MNGIPAVLTMVALAVLVPGGWVALTPLALSVALDCWPRK